MKYYLAFLLLTIQWTYGQSSKDIKRLAYCDSLERVSEEQKKPLLKAEAYYIRGKMASERFEIKESNEWLFKALEIHRSLGPSTAYGKVYGYLANNAGITHNKVDFEFFLNQAESIYEQVGSREGLEDIKLKKATLYHGAFDSKPEYRKAIDSYKNTLSKVISSNPKDSLQIATLNLLIGYNLLNLNDKSALKHFEVTERIYKFMKNEQLIACYLVQADALMAFKRYAELEAKMKQIEILKESMELDIEKLIHYHHTMSAYFSYKNDPVKSLENSLAAEQIQSIMNKKSQIDFSEFYAKSETIKNQNTIISKRGSYLIVGLLLIVVLAFFVVWFARNYRIKSRQEHKSSLLVQEVNHRIKNNFQTLANLLLLQENEILDSDSRQALEETQQRINSLAIVHSHLYGRPILERVDMEEFLNELVSQILKVFNFNDSEFNLEVKASPLIAEKAILLGLIVNEWVTNICKYAFSNDRSNRIDVSLHEGSFGWKLSINDFGTSKIEVVKTSSFGVNLIQKLVDQLDGDLKYNHFQNLSEISFKST